MKKLITALTIFIIVFTLVLPASASSSFVYEDSNAKVKFTIPENWHQDEFKTTTQFLNAKFVYDSDEIITIMYGSYDMWSDMTPSEKKGYSRSDLNNEIFTLDDIATMLGVSKSSISKATYNKSEYFMTTITQTKYGITVTMTCACRIENGWMYQFQFLGTKESARYSDFESVLKSVEYPKSVSNSSTSQSSANSYTASTSNNDVDGGSIILGLLFSLLITITIYTIPVVIYRYGVKKEPLSKKKAKKFTIIYAIIGFFLMSLISFAIDGNAATGGGLILWSFVNYRILTKSNDNLDSLEENTPPVCEDSSDAMQIEDEEISIKDEQSIYINYGAIWENDNNETLTMFENSNTISDTDAQMTLESVENSNEKKSSTDNIAIIENKIQENIKIPTTEIETQTQTEKNAYIYCRKCGTKLSADSKFCNKCGTKVIKI